jgi:hypothetical protein
VAAQKSPQLGLKPKFFIAADNREAYLLVAKALGPEKVFWTDNRIAPPRRMPHRTNRSIGVKDKGVTAGVVPSAAAAGSTLLTSAYTEVRNRVWALWPKRSKNPGTDHMAIVDLILLARCGVWTTHQGPAVCDEGSDESLTTFHNMQL